ncbi:MAG: 23S rRNA (adenine(2503)-C(2))-methyltransferase RlmN [bacterium]|nr:23S rRNA (adenine(2503)-C(2))-methyltransferase RlmN [bacterium]
MLASLYNLSEEELKAWLSERGFKPYVSDQLLRWLYPDRVGSFEEMSNLSKALRSALAESFSLELPQIKLKSQAPDGTLKFLTQLHDGAEIETVLLRHEDHNTLCLSTQVGCAMGCKFCLTASMGLVRNLEPYEILAQVFLGVSLLPAGEGVRNLVFMGMGEPLHNFNHLVAALKNLLNPKGLGYSWRRITISTSGLLEEIQRFWDEPGINANLAISLNGVTQEARAELMPVGKRHRLEDLIALLKRLPLETRERITFEYVLLKEVTDDLASAKRLVALLNGIKAKVNLIPFNEVPSLPYQAPSAQQVKDFQRFLLDRGLMATIRKSRGQEVSAACGQLAVGERRRGPILMETP